MARMEFTRRSGVLAHPTSFPRSAGIGTIGKEAFAFLDWMRRAEQTLWQILPLGPTGYGDSPYASFSTFAGNPYLIDLDALVEKGWARAQDIAPPSFIKSEGNVDYGAVYRWKPAALEKCAEYFLARLTAGDSADYEAFKRANSGWLEDYAAFTSIKSRFDKEAKERGAHGKDGMWNAFWPRGLASHDGAALSKWAAENAEAMERVKAVQFFFDSQWRALKKRAAEFGIDIIGDIPIFVAGDSADVWANQKFFQLQKSGVPKKVAGVPPDYFSATGQLWGNPLYDWGAMKADGYSWWTARIKRCLELVDCVRIDHFRGFESYWSVDYGSATAKEGEWVKGPGMDLFRAVKKSLGAIPIIAEDLGVITDEVRALRDGAGFPGMKVLQFAFDPNEAGKEGMKNAFLPHEYKSPSCVVYTGTHDNDTTQGWIDKSDGGALALVARYADGRDVSADEAARMAKSGALCESMVRMAMASTAVFCVTPLQDILALGSEARMNTPATTGGNWAWRMESGALTDSLAKKLSFLTRLYGRA